MMGRLLRNIRAVLVLAFAVSPSSWAATTTCTGKFMNPITDICWSCAFPLKVGGTTIMDFGQEDFDSGVSNPLCACSSPPKVGLSISFYEPARLVEVVRKPYCFPSLGGITIDPGVPAPAHVQTRGGKSFYQAHWYISPLMFWLEEASSITRAWNRMFSTW